MLLNIYEIIIGQRNVELTKFSHEFAEENVASIDVGDRGPKIS